MRPSRVTAPRRRRRADSGAQGGGNAGTPRHDLDDEHAEAAHQRLRAAGVTLHNDEVVRLDGTPPMCFFADADGNGLVLVEEDAPDTAAA